MRCTFKTVFYVNGSKERNGIVPIMGRVTINGTIALQAERDHGYLGFQGQQSHRQEQGSKKVNLLTAIVLQLYGGTNTFS